jgi:hypothetical protein
VAYPIHMAFKRGFKRVKHAKSQYLDHNRTWIYALMPTNMQYIVPNLMWPTLIITNSHNKSCNHMVTTNKVA